MKLWENASDHCKLRIAGGDGSRSFRAAARLPVVYWPNGAVCWQVTAYLISLRLVRRKTSSLETYAAQLSPVLRFLQSLGKGLDDIDDDILVMFANWLLDSGKKGSRVNRTIEALFQFLGWYQQRSASGKRLIGLPGTDSQITVTPRRQHRRGGAFAAHGYNHPALAEPSVPRLVTPMPMAHIRLMQGAVRETSQRSFVRARNRALLLMLIESGVRRLELTLMSKTVFERALAGTESLPVRNAKRKDGADSMRLVPVDMEALKTVSDFVNRQRASRMAKNRDKNPQFRDLDYLFCKENGERLSPSTVTRLFSSLKSAAGIAGRAHAHMLRHRWITLQLAALLKELQTLGTPLAPGLIVTALTRLASRSGHSHVDSLWTYVDFASEEMLAASALGDTQKVAKATLHQISNLLEKLSVTQSLEEEGLRLTIKELRLELAKTLGHATLPKIELSSKLR